VSFILDALRKSESERQQDSAPNIARIPDAVPQRRLPAWALATMATLALGIVVLGIAWWRTAQNPAVTMGRPAAAASGTPLPIPPPRSESRIEATSPIEAPSDRVARTTLRDAAASGRAESSSSGAISEPVAQPARRIASLPDVDPQLQRYSSGSATLPALRLELHAYGEDTASRFVFINGAKYVEGDTLPEGPRLVAITADGAVLLAGGRQYLLGQE
jgi:general secretion pathway protein B